MPIKRDHTKLICDVGELSGLFSDAPSLEVFLQRIVEVIGDHMHAAVCSIYLYYEDAHELVLTATKGLKNSAVGQVKLKLGEGLTGLALQEMRPICEKNASKTQGYRYFPEIGEEAYESFLAVPILRGHNRIGAIVVQNARKNYFSEEDIRALQAITSQIANTIEMTKLLMEFKKQPPVVPVGVAEKDLKLVKGKVGSEGFAFGEAIVWDNRHLMEVLKDACAQKTYTLKDFKEAVELTERELELLQKQIEDTLFDVASLIFTAQILMLKDQVFIGAIEGLIRGGMNPPQAVCQAVDDYVRMFDALPNMYLKEKKQDVQDMGRRLLRNILGFAEHVPDFQGHIVVAQELFPSDILKLSSQGVAGIILLSGGISSHLSILARSLGLPLVIAEEKRLIHVREGIPVLLDAEQGNIYINPTPDVVRTHAQKEEDRKKMAEAVVRARPETYAQSGERIILLSNINLLGDLKMAQAVKSEGVGLYRTEFPFIVRSDFPSEEEQYIVYRKLVESMAGKEVTFRTLDIGGDKVLSYYDYEKEENPFLGMRSIRFSLKHRDVFLAQLRAILRAGAGADLRIMFPMISSIDEFLEAKELVAEALTQLQNDGNVHNGLPKVGAMIELPAVLEIIDALAQEADFFSIGTNDFIQYMLGVDRTNEKVADFYLPHHPSVLRALKRVVDAAGKHGIDVSICGDMAHNPAYVPYLLGIGIRKLSLDSRYIPRVQEAIETVSIKAARAKARTILSQSLIQKVGPLFQFPDAVTLTKKNA